MGQHEEGHLQVECRIPVAGSAKAAKASYVGTLFFHVRTLMLFTYSDHVTIVAPWTAFGIITILSGKPLTTSVTNSHEVLKRAPYTALWIWLNALAFCISNQRLPDSIAEDAINKPWRPLPSGRITELQSRRLLLAVIPIVVFVAFLLGGREACICNLLLAWMYNDLGGADEACIVRHLLNAWAMASWGLGVAQVACGSEQCSLSAMGYLWVATMGAIVFTTIQLMDLRDQAGDLARGRITIPIAFGDLLARWTVVVGVIAWSVICLVLWSPGLVGSLLPLGLGLLISVRLLLLRNERADRISWNLWGPWIFSIFLLPLFRHQSVLEKAIVQTFQSLQHWGLGKH